MIQVIKRDGSKEPLNLEKFHNVVSYACKDLTGVSASEVELASQIQFQNNIKTSDVQETLIKAAANLISEDNPNYQYVAARLVNYHLRKEVYGKYEPDKLYAHYKRIRDLGFYDPEIGESFSDEEWGKLNSWIDHGRDDNLSYIAMEQFRGKYLVKDRSTKKFFETPQIAFMLISMTLFMQDKAPNRLTLIKDFYDALSKFKISLPSPIMAGVRTPERQFASCILIDTDDTLDSIIAANGAITKYVAKRAGIGTSKARLRGLGEPVNGGKVIHTGLVPYIKYDEAAVASSSQGGLRKGSATMNLWFLHHEVEDLLVLKNSKGTEETRARNLDYVFHLNKVIYERVLNNQNLTLLSPKDHPELFQAYYTDVDKFRELYEKAERSRCKKKVVSAQELFGKLITERVETGRVYIMNVDNVNDHSAYIPELAPVHMTNLCTEITQYTKPLKHLFDEEGEIGLCTLAAVNFGEVKELTDLEYPSYLLVRALDNLLSFQEYLLPAARNCGEKRRSIGIGFTNLAYWLAKNDTNYSNPDLEKIHALAEAYSYYIIKASADLAEERGACEKSDESRYSKGILPIHTYKKTVDELVKPEYKYDWKTLASKLSKTGIRNYPLMAEMPVESSSATTNSTNGMEPIPSIVTIKGSKDLMTKQVAPESRKLKNKYELKWNIRSPEGYLHIAAVFQKFMDQAASVNTTYNPNFYDGEVPMSVLVQDIVNFYRYGGKCLYYNNILDGAGEIEDKEEEVCDSCTV